MVYVSSITANFGFGFKYLHFNGPSEVVGLAQCSPDEVRVLFSDKPLPFGFFYQRLYDKLDSELIHVNLIPIDEIYAFFQDEDSIKKDKLMFKEVTQVFDNPVVDFDYWLEELLTKLF